MTGQDLFTGVPGAGADRFGLLGVVPPPACAWVEVSGTVMWGVSGLHLGHPVPPRRRDFRIRGTHCGQTRGVHASPPPPCASPNRAGSGGDPHAPASLTGFSCSALPAFSSQAVPWTRWRNSYGSATPSLPLSVPTSHHRVFRFISPRHLTVPLLLATVVTGTVTAWRSVFFIALVQEGPVCRTVLAVGMTPCAVVSLAVGLLGARCGGGCPPGEACGRLTAGRGRRFTEPACSAAAASSPTPSGSRLAGW